MLTLPISACLSYADESKLHALFAYPNQTESELDQAIAKHRLADLDVDMVIPADCTPSTQRLIRALHQDLVKQRRALSAANERLHGSETNNMQLRETNRKLREECKILRQGKHDSDPIDALQGAFDDERDQLDFEIRTAWALRIPAGSKADLPLRRWEYGPNFFDSLHMLHGFDHGKIVDVIVEILTGLVRRIDGRDLHELRTGTGGEAPVRRTADGDAYWRAALQLNSPGGRRIHFYTRRANGVIVLSSVRTHDDYRA